MPTSWSELKSERLASMTEIERAEYEGAYAAAGLSSRELARRMRTSQAAVFRLEGGGCGVRQAQCRRLD
jgi:predicted transcriptional regulator